MTKHQTELLTKIQETKSELVKTRAKGANRSPKIERLENKLKALEKFKNNLKNKEGKQQEKRNLKEYFQNPYLMYVLGFITLIFLYGVYQLIKKL